MPKKDGTPKECKDVFHAFLVEKANYEGDEEIPCIKTSILIPLSRKKLLHFQKRLHQPIMTNGLCFTNRTSVSSGCGTSRISI